MRQPKFNISEKVAVAINNFVAVSGKEALLKLDRGQCNDFAASIVQLISFETGGCWVRHETVTRRIREVKASYRREIAFQFNNNLNKGQV